MPQRTLITPRRSLRITLVVVAVLLLAALVRPVAAVRAPFEFDGDPIRFPDLATSLAWYDFNPDDNPAVTAPELLAIGKRDDLVAIVPSDGLLARLPNPALGSLVELIDSFGARQVAWAAEGDPLTTGSLLLGVARDGFPSKVFEVAFDPDTLLITANEIWQGPLTPPRTATSLAWADLNADGRQDLILGFAPGGVEVHLAAGDLPAGRTWLLSQTIAPATSVQSLSLASTAGGAPDLIAVGVSATGGGERSAVYRLAPTGLVDPPIWQDSIAGPTVAVAWGNFNTDGRPDLVVTSYGDSSRVYLANDAPAVLAAVPAWVAPAKENTLAIAVGDVDGDGLDDVFSQRYIAAAPGAATLSGVLYSSSVENGVFRLIRQDWDALPGAAQDDQTLGAALLADYSRDGSLDLLTATSLNNQFGVGFFRNLRLTAFELQVLDQAGGGQPGAFIFRQPANRPAELFQPYRDQRTGRLLTTDNDGVLFLRDDLRAGDRLVAMAPILTGATTASRTTATTGLPLPLPDNQVVTATLQVNDEGRIQDLRVEQLGIDHTFLGDLVVTLISPAGTRAILLNQACGRNEGSTSITVTVTDDEFANDCPITDGAIVAPFDPLTTFVGEELRGLWRLEIVDAAPRDTGTLRSWQLTAQVADSALYYTNAAVLNTGTIAVDTIVGNVLEPQFIQVVPENPLLLFNLDVSLEWDARNDTGFLQQLRFDLTRTAELLYDFTDGQATVLQYTIFHDRERWNSADIRIYASNRLRPNADQGGVSAGLRVEPENNDVVYGPGQIRIGSVWNRNGAAAGTLGEDWPRALAHELGHYLLYLDDNYLGYDRDGNVIGIPTANQLTAPCRGAMFDPYRSDESEFHPDSEWLTRCARTFSGFYTGRSDWATIRQFYPALKQPQQYNANPGPEVLPFALPQISESAVSTPATTLGQNFFATVGSVGERLLPTAGSRAILFQGNRAVDLGSPILDQVTARGIRQGDELCVYDRVDARVGCVTADGEATRLPVLSVPTWRPDIRLIPLSATRIRIEMRLAADDLAGKAVTARFYPTDQDAVFSTALTRSGALYSGEIEVTGRNRPVQQGLLRVIVDEPNRTSGGEPLPRREAITDYIQHGLATQGPDPAPLPVADLGDPSVEARQCGFDDFPPCPTPRPRRTPRPRDAPASSDGQATLYGAIDRLEPGDFFTFQAASELRRPLPPWSEPVGTGYWLNGSPLDIGERLIGTAYNAAYLERELPPGTQGGLAIFFWEPATAQWERLQLTRNDPARNEVTARTRGLGLYALMTTLAPGEGWNLLSYPWRAEDQSVPAALARLNATETHYTTVYGYDEATRRWSVYDNRLGEWAGLVNTLDRLQYGRGYWVQVTAAGAAGSRITDLQPTPAALQAELPTPVIQLTPTPSATPTATPLPTGSGAPTPPATYYGELASGAGLEAASGLRVEALINGRVCGEGRTQPYNGRIAFVVQVEADRGGFNGCGGESRVITWRVDGRVLPNVTVWDNTRPYLITLNGDTRVWFPLIGLKVAAPSPCVVACENE